MGDWDDDKTEKRSAAAADDWEQDDWGDSTNSQAQVPKASSAANDDFWGEANGASNSAPKSDWDTGDSSGRGQGGFRGGRGDESGRGGGGDRAPREDNWTCPNETCRASVFANKRKCFKCQTDNPNLKEDKATRVPRDDDWTCPDCNVCVFASKSECFKCHVPNPNFIDSRASRVARDDDWTCPDCNVTVYSSKSECFKCYASNPNYKEKAPRVAREDDWTCSDCNVTVYSSKSECFKCHAPNPKYDKNSDKPRENYVPPEPTTDEEVMYGSGISAGINFKMFDKIEVAATGNGAEEIKRINSFNDAGLRPILIDNIERSGYKCPTPIQRFALPIILAKRDLMGCAQTGSGKTAAFMVPILNMIFNAEEQNIPGQPQCLIIAPTRELVIQIFDEARKFANKSWIKICKAYGGTQSRQQGEIITNGCHVLVATPGRLIDYVEKAVVSFESLKFLVLDEADRMLDMGFKTSIHKVVTNPTIKKDQLQTLMFSATFPEDIQKLAGTYLRDYIFLTVGIVGGASTDVAQEIFEVERFKKREKLKETLKAYCQDSEEDRILVFVETKKQADFLASFLSETKMSTTSIHGDRLQSEREAALRDFRNGKHKVLIATSVAARGLDIKGVTHVINFDLPKEIEEYVHRIGRTGRVGNSGKATSFFEQGRDEHLAADLARILTDAGQPVPMFLGEARSESTANEGFGGSDIRATAAGTMQEEEESWD